MRQTKEAAVLRDDEARAVVEVGFGAGPGFVARWSHRFDQPVSPDVALVRLAAHAGIIRAVHVRFVDGETAMLDGEGLRAWLRRREITRPPRAGDVALLKELGVRAMVRVLDVRREGEMDVCSLEVLDWPAPSGSCAPDPGTRFVVRDRAGSRGMAGWRLQVLLEREPT